MTNQSNSARVPVVQLINNKPVVSSLDVAKHFNKRHDNVLRDIRQLLNRLPRDFVALNFEFIGNSIELGHGTR